MNAVLAVVNAVAWFLSGWACHRARAGRRDTWPFEFICPDCRFEVKGNDPGMVITIGRKHEEIHG